MKEAQLKWVKAVNFALIMLVFVGAVAFATHTIVYNRLQAEQLYPPTNVVFLYDEKTLMWDAVEGAETYSIQIYDRTTPDSQSSYNPRTLYITPAMWTVEEFAKRSYSLLNFLENDKNYSIRVKANSNKAQNSVYSEAYELMQVNPIYDANPYTP